MKLRNALVVFSCMGLMSLTACGVDGAQAADEVSTGSVGQALCNEPALPADCSSMIYTAALGLSCSTSTSSEVPYMCDTSDGKCRWYGCNGGTTGNWGRYSYNCATFQANFCH